jgi:outer membrane protein assembly factor BamD (BamD/ComL family)
MTCRISQATLVVALALVAGCAGLGRRVNQSLPEFMRGEPGAEEKERIQTLQQRLQAPAGASAARTRAFERAKRAYEACQFDCAADFFEDFLDEYPSSEFDEEARFLLGESHYRDDDYTEAFAAYKAHAERYPVSNRAPCIEERVYRMGCSFLSGRRKSFLGIFSNRGLGEEMFLWIVETYPNAPRADDAQWALGRYYVSEADWPKAAGAFDLLVKQYPGSEWFPAGTYFSGYTRYRQVKGTVYDQAIVRESRKRFAQYVAQFPEGPWRSQAERLICVLDDVAAQKLLNVARWYVGQGCRWAARYYLERLIKLYPASRAAARGSALLATLPVTQPGAREAYEVAARFAADEPEAAETRPEAGAPESAPAPR